MCFFTRNIIQKLSVSSFCVNNDENSDNVDEFYLMEYKSILPWIINTWVAHIPSNRMQKYSVHIY